MNEYKVGDGATWRIHTDCHAGTIIKVTPTTVTWQRDKATLLNGMNSDEPDKLVCYPGGFAGHVEGRQRYEYERDPDGEIRKFSLRVIKPGRYTDGYEMWKLAGHRTRSPGNTLHPGRSEHYDYNF